jgi:transposase, IS5 family
MQPKNNRRKGKQIPLFETPLKQIISQEHPLYQLSEKINWTEFEKAFGSLYVENVGRPGKSIRLLVGLHYLKYTYSESDEGVVEKFLENPYWQYFCGFEYFQHEMPIDPSSLTRWRKRVGAEGMEKLLKETVETAKGEKLITRRDVQRVNVDTTVQEKAIAFPTDARLYYKMLRSLVRAAKERGIELRQSYERVGKKALARQGRYSHARQMKRARRETKKLKTYLGRVSRDIQRKVATPDEKLNKQLQLSQRLLKQQRHDKGKLYSIHAPEVECIAKGKVHKQYEFGCKVSMISTSKKNWLIGIDAIHGNPYDGHTLEGTLKQAKRITGWKPENAYCDRGYRGNAGKVNDTQVHIVGRRKKSISRSELKWLKRRSAIEPMFGHLKAENRMSRNLLPGKEGDRINAILSGCGYNMRKLIRAFFVFILKWIFFVQKDEKSFGQTSEPALLAV